jgi:hypothetical protein
MNLDNLQNVPAWQWPEDAGSTILKFVIDPRASESDRIAAAELAGDLVVMNDHLAEALLAIVRNDKESDELRGRAAISLGPVLEQASNEEFEGQFDDPDAVPVSKHMYHEIKDSLRQLYTDERIAKEVRRRILEASVRAPEDWHRSAINAACASGDSDWMLTAVFAMRWVPGFNDEILEALNSTDLAIHCEAVQAAGQREVDAAWPHVVRLVNDPTTPRPLLLAAIEAVGYIRPREAGVVLIDLADFGDAEVAQAADEAMGMAESLIGDELGLDDEQYEEEEADEEEEPEESQEDEDDEDEEDEDEESDWVN